MQKINLEKIKRWISILRDSKVVCWLGNLYKNYENKMAIFSKSSIIVKSTEDLKRQFNLMPLRACGIVVIVAIVVNTALSIILKTGIDLPSMFLRITFVCMGIGSLFCTTRWDDIKKNSFIIRCIRRLK